MKLLKKSVLAAVAVLLLIAAIYGFVESDTPVRRVENMNCVWNTEVEMHTRNTYYIPVKIEKEMIKCDTLFIKAKCKCLNKL